MENSRIEFRSFTDYRFTNQNITRITFSDHCPCASNHSLSDIFPCTINEGCPRTGNLNDKNLKTKCIQFLKKTKQRWNCIKYIFLHYSFFTFRLFQLLYKYNFILYIIILTLSALSILNLFRLDALALHSFSLNLWLGSKHGITESKSHYRRHMVTYSYILWLFFFCGLGSIVYLKTHSKNI